MEVLKFNFGLNAHCALHTLRVQIWASMHTLCDILKNANRHNQVNNPTLSTTLARTFLRYQNSDFRAVLQLLQCLSLPV